MTDLHGMLKALHQERKLLDEVIAALEILARGTGKRRGRPPRWLRDARQEYLSRPKPPGRKPVRRES